MAHRTSPSGLLAALALATAACSADGRDPLGPVVLEPSFNVEQPSLSVAVCKHAWAASEGLPDDGTLGQSFGFSIAHDHPTIPQLAPFSVVAQGAGTDLSKCKVFTRPGIAFEDVTNITLTETVPPGYVLKKVVFEGTSGTSVENPASSTVTFKVLSGGVVHFYNAVIPPPPPVCEDPDATNYGGPLPCEYPPPPGGEGCTPGYWKQSHHFDSWQGYTPGQYFDAVFGVGPHVTLLKALGTGGGGAKALGRHAVAALLSSAHGAVDYDLATAGVIALVQQAYASGDFEGPHLTLAAFNEQGCPLN
jgi:hypothetical protein